MKTYRTVSLIPAGVPHEYTEVSVIYGGGSYWLAIARFVSGNHCVSREYGLHKRIMNASLSKKDMDKAVGIVKDMFGI